MKILCVSASNTKNTGFNSTSTKVCGLISEIITKEYDDKAVVDIIQLAEYNLLPCNLCGKCDYQCYFVTELRPIKVMTALKDQIAEFKRSGKEIFRPSADRVLTEIRNVVGNEWATNDPAILYSYCHDLSPVSPPKIPDYIVLPNTRTEIQELVKIFNKHQLTFTVRGNGANLLGFAINQGVILDMNRMKTIEFNEKKWFVKTGPGVTAFELQQEAVKRGFRISTGEPAAMICSNIMGSGVMSTFSTTYGINGDNFIDAEFVSNKGEVFHLNESTAPNLYSYKDLHHPDSPGICTSANIRLHPMTDDEEGILIPFSNRKDAIVFIGDVSIRHIGIAIALLGMEYISNFFALTKKMAAETKNIFEKKINMPYLVLMIGDKYARNAICEMNLPYIDQELLRTLYLGLPALKNASWLDLIDQIADDQPYSYLKLQHFKDLVEIALDPSPELFSSEAEPSLQNFYSKLYSKPHMTDMVWLTMFRILSTRVGRRKGFLPIVIYLPIDFDLIREITDQYIEIAEINKLEHAFGFITPIDHGKRCIYEYDYFFDYLDTEELERIREAADQVNHLIDGYSVNNGTVKGHPYVLHQGFSRKENLLYS
jgi:UDP-N-acetylenolpyruvoylglucosamine reductase